MTHPTDDEIDAIAAQTLGEHTANKLTGIKRFARALLATQVRPEHGTQATREPVGLPVFTPLNPIQEVYEKLHAGKLGAHWLWVVIEQIAAGIPEEDAMREFGYYATQPLKAEQAKDAAEDAELLDRYGKIRGDLKASAYCVGNEYKPFHPGASHVRPEWRDGWNACYVAAIRAARAAERKAWQTAHNGA